MRINPIELIKMYEGSKLWHIVASAHRTKCGKEITSVIEVKKGTDRDSTCTQCLLRIQ